MAKVRVRRRVALRTVCKLGTIAHNRPFSARDFYDYVGRVGRVDIHALQRRGIIKKTGPNTYYPTAKGWNAIERACRMWKGRD
jgi:hypothetical protein